jgi:hypothetical protein
MSEPDPPSKKSEEMRNFRTDVTLIIVGLFLALGIQSLVQFVAVSFPRIDAYFYVAVGVGSILLVLVFINRAARIAGIDVEREHSRRQK